MNFSGVWPVNYYFSIMENIKRLEEIYEDLKSLVYQDRNTLNYVKAKSQQAIACIKQLPEEDDFIDETVAIIKKDVDLIDHRSNPQDGFDECMDDLLYDLKSIVDRYF